MIELERSWRKIKLIDWIKWSKLTYSANSNTTLVFVDVPDDAIEHCEAPLTKGTNTKRLNHAKYDSSLNEGKRYIFEEQSGSMTRNTLVTAKYLRERESCRGPWARGWIYSLDSSRYRAAWDGWSAREKRNTGSSLRSSSERHSIHNHSIQDVRCTCTLGRH